KLSLVGFTGGFNPFLTLSFLALPVIPDIKMTTTGLFDVKKFKQIALQKKKIHTKVSASFF
ncbi:hypothetical protein MOC65_19865, partial [Bacillus spizizenii]|nr:hypothetical protein [Bacillus spizizenii]